MTKNIYLLTLLILLNINELRAQVEVWEIQGDGIFSPYLNETVTTNQNVVTVVGDDFFFMQTPTYRSDNSPMTSDGIKVVWNNTPTVEVGNLISLTGVVREQFQRTQFDKGDGLTITIDSAEVALPLPVILTNFFPSGTTPNLPDLEKVEGMLVQFPQAITTAPTNQYGETPIKIGTIRSFREAGIISPAPSGLPEWDGNPEVFEIKLNALGLADELLAGGMNISATGVIDYDFGDYILLPTEYEITSDAPFRAVNDPTPTEATIGSINCFVLSNLESEYAIRRQKVAAYIVDMMKAPDIVAVQEVRSLAVLQDLANLINENHPEINYTPYLISNGTGGSFVINVGYLVKNTVSDVQVTQLGADEQFSFGGKLHYRPPLLLEAIFNSTPPKSIKVLNLHLKSLNGITGGNATAVRTRRHEQALSVAQMVEANIDENLVVVGDFNAFQFSDGYVDVVNQIAGTTSLGAEYSVQNIVSTPLTNLSESLLLGERYSYVYQGNAQILDHCLVTDFQGLTISSLQYVRANADYSEDFTNQISPLYHTSDHDGFVLFLEVGSELSTSSNEVFQNIFSVKYPNPFLQNNTITFNLKEKDVIHFSITNQVGEVVFEKNFGKIAEGEYIETIPLSLPTGVYFLNIKGEKNNFTGKIIYQK